MTVVEAVDVALRDGSTVRVRPVEAADIDQLRELLAGLSAESLWLRFFTAGVNLETMARWASSRGGGHGYGVVATAGSPERIVGHAAYVRDSRRPRARSPSRSTTTGTGRASARSCSPTSPPWRRRDGIDRFVATVHPSNHRMAQVFRDSGFPVEVTVGRGSCSSSCRRRWTPTPSRRSKTATASRRSPPSSTSCGRPRLPSSAVRAAAHDRRRAARQPARRRLRRTPVRRPSRGGRVGGLPVTARIEDVPGPSTSP